MQILQSIQNRIYELRGERIMIDFDLAQLYEVETKVLNQAVKRNIKRFPEDFMFRLTLTEWEMIRTQFVDGVESAGSMRSQIVTTYQNRRTSSALPYAFTEQGVAMLSGILNSNTAINMNISIMRAFVAIRKIVSNQNDVTEQLTAIKERLGGHDLQLSQVYEALENLLNANAAQIKWKERQRIGFRP